MDLTLWQQLRAVFREMPDYVASTLARWAYLAELSGDRRDAKRLDLHANPRTMAEYGICWDECARCDELAGMAPKEPA